MVYIPIIALYSLFKGAFSFMPANKPAKGVDMRAKIELDDLTAYCRENKISVDSLAYIADRLSVIMQYNQPVINGYGDIVMTINGHSIDIRQG